jgi:hypothetical protein
LATTAVAPSVTNGATVVSVTIGIVVGTVSTTAKVVVVVSIDPADGLSSLIWPRIKNPATTATTAMMIAAVDPTGDVLEAVSRDRFGCSLLM